MTANERIEQLIRNRELKQQGVQLNIPLYYHFPKLATQLPGLFRKGMFKLLCATGVGKTKFTKYVNIMIPYYVSKRNGLKYKTIYFALEESEEEFIDNLLLFVMKQKYAIDLTYMDLNSYNEDLMKQDVINKIKDCEHDVDEMLKNVIIIDDTFTATGMFIKCKEVAESLGTIVSDDDGRIISYEPNDPDMFVTVVADHLSLIQGEFDRMMNKYLSVGEAMAKWSTYFCMKILTKRFNWIVWNVQQTIMTGEDFNRKKTHTLEPQIADAANNKEILRDDKVIITLFSPYEHKIEKYGNWTIVDRYSKKGLKHTFRSLSLLKNRYGRKDISLGLHFEGGTGVFTELDVKKQEEYYV